ASRAIALAASGQQARGLNLASVEERAGLGVEARLDNSVYRLGRAGWALDATDAEDGTVLSRDGVEIARFTFTETIRPGAAEAVSALKASGLSVEVLSGDRQGAVAAVAGRLRIDRFAAGLMPGDKVAHLESAQASGLHVLMVGDGLNDAPALSVAHVSMAPATAADIGRNAADFVFLRESLAAVPFAFDIARRAGGLVRQNFAIAVVYNALAMPVAMAGYVTPLIAAVAMSVSSVIVVANALRLRPPGMTAEGKRGAAPQGLRPMAAR
ncbi:MAG: HAD-IC family P-type ATPase, partial [Mesorhizobium sp.]|nr:HAD-IC family P-type ATPase [Mesorhizobium sp.]